jgi:hypothetical protein
VHPRQSLPAGTRDADARTDVYQLGKVLYELLTDEVPHLLDLDRVSSGLRFVIQKATRNRPEERYQSVGEMLDAIVAYELAHNPQAHPTSAFDNLLIAVTQMVEQGQYDHEQVRQLVAVVLRVKDDSRMVVETVERIPDALIQVAVANMTRRTRSSPPTFVRSMMRLTASGMAMRRSLPER